MSNTGRAAVSKTTGEHYVIEEFPVPQPEPSAVLLRTIQAGICGSDMHGWRGDFGSRVLPGNGTVAGHEGFGAVEALGEGVTTDSLGQPIEVGDRLMYSVITPCNRCRQCLSGHQNWCIGRNLPDRPAGVFPYFTGTFGDYYYLEAGRVFFKVPEVLEDDVLSWVNCAMGTATEALMQAGTSEGDYVVVLGAGGLGLNAIPMAKDMGAHRVIAVDRLRERLDLAEEFGATATLCVDEYPEAEDRVAQVWELTDGRGADIVIELASAPALMPEGLEMLARGGVYAVVGSVVPGETVAIEPAKLVRDCKRIVGSWCYRPIHLHMMLEMLVKNQAKLPYHKIGSHKYPLEQVNAAFEAADSVGGRPTVARGVIVP